MGDAALGLFDGAAFDGEDDVLFGVVFDDIDDFFPVDDPVAAGAADGGASDFASFLVALLDGDVLSVEVDESCRDVLEPGVGVLSREVGVTGIEIDAYGGAIDESADSIEA